MKTLLLWGVETTLSQHIAYQLSVEGHRVLVTGSNFDNLQGLDVALCQSELHRFHALVTPRAVAEWVNEQHLGLDGVVLFPPPPEPGGLLTPLSANLRRADRSVYGAIELLRELAPQLRRGKRPKRVLVVLAWDESNASPHVTTLVNLWRTITPHLADELEPYGTEVNVLLTDAQMSPSDDSVARLTDSAPADPEDESDSGRASIVPCDNAVFAARWFSAALSPLSGQFVHHPNRKVLRAGRCGS